MSISKQIIVNCDVEGCDKTLGRPLHTGMRKLIEQAEDGEWLTFNKSHFCPGCAPAAREFLNLPKPVSAGPG